MASRSRVGLGTTAEAQPRDTVEAATEAGEKVETDTRVPSRQCGQIYFMADFTRTKETKCLENMKIVKEVIMSIQFMARTLQPHGVLKIMKTIITFA